MKKATDRGAVQIHSRLSSIGLQHRVAVANRNVFQSFAVGRYATFYFLSFLKSLGQNKAAAGEPGDVLDEFAS